MTRRRLPQTSFARGELDPEIATKEDLKHYFSGLLKARNCVVKPQGAVQLKPGQPFFGFRRRKLSEFTVTAGMLTAPNSGTVANLVDDDAATFLTTTDPGVDPSDFVLVHIDLAAAQSIAAVDLEVFSAATAAADGVLKVEYSTDNAVFTLFDTARNIRTSARSRRFAAPPREPVTARYWRVTIDGTTPAIGAVSIAELKMWQEGDLATAARNIDFSFSVSDTVQIIMTENNADVVLDGAWVASVSVPHLNDQLVELAWTQSLDTLLLWHKDVEPWRLFRQGSNTEWNFGAAPFTDIPQFRFEETYANAATARQAVSFFAGTPTSPTVRFVLEGETTEPIFYNQNNAAATRLAIIAAIEALPNVDPGITVTIANLISWTIEFTGGANVNRPWLELEMIFINSPDASFAVENEVEGTPGGEPLMSPTRGYPRHGIIVQGRLLMGGFRSEPRALLYSRAGELFDVDTELEGSTGAFLELLDADDQREVRRFWLGRHLQIFTATSTHYLANRTIDREEPRNYIQTENSTGIRAGARPTDLQGATIYLGVEGASVEEFLWQDAEQAYRSQNIALFNNHLIDDVVDLAHRPSLKDKAGDTLFIIRSDGELAVGSALRAQDVTGITPVAPDGKVRSVSVDTQKRVWITIERDVGGTPELMLEGWDQDHFLDSYKTFAFGPAQTTVSGLDHLEGKIVYALADGDIQGPFTVTAGAIELDDEASDVTVGLFVVPEIEMMPLRDPNTASAPNVPVRIYEAELSLLETGSIAVGTNTTAPRDIPLRTLGDGLLDTPMMDTLVSADIDVDKLYGFSKVATLKITQTVPGPLHILTATRHYKRPS